MKKIIMLLVLLLSTGCGAKYELNIKKDTIEENISFSMQKNGINNTDQIDIDVNSDQYIDSLIDSKISAITDNTSKNDFYYQKDIKQEGNIYNFKLFYEYKKDDYLKSRVVNECFENHYVNFENDKTYIHLSGKFYCFQDEEIEIIINSSNKINKSNGTRSGSSYKWIINKDNYNNVDIEIEISSKEKVRYYIYVAFATVFLVIIAYFGFVFYGKYVSRNSINDI